MKKISKKYSGVLMGALMGIFMSTFMSLIVTFINLGSADNFIEMWLKALAFSFPVSFPAALILTPIVKNMVEKITE